MLSRRSILRALGFGAPAAAVAAAVGVPIDSAYAEQMERSRRLVTASYIDAIDAEMGSITAGRIVVRGASGPIDGSMVIDFNSGTFTVRS